MESKQLRHRQSHDNCVYDQVDAASSFERVELPGHVAGARNGLVPVELYRRAEHECLTYDRDQVRKSDHHDSIAGDMKFASGEQNRV